MGEVKNAYKILIGEPRRKRPHGGHSWRSEDNVRLDLREMGWQGVDWIHLARGRDHFKGAMNTAMNLQVP